MYIYYNFHTISNLVKFMQERSNFEHELVNGVYKVYDSTKFTAFLIFKGKKYETYSYDLESIKLIFNQYTTVFPWET